MEHSTSSIPSAEMMSRASSRLMLISRCVLKPAQRLVCSASHLLLGHHVDLGLRAHNVHLRSSSFSTLGQPGGVLRM